MWTRLAAATTLSIALSATPGRADPARIDYMLNCQGCHLPGGEGYPERSVPRLTGHMGLFLGVEGGRAFLAQVPGAALSDLSDDRLAAVLNWMLRTFSGDQIPAGFEPYEGPEVGALRQAPLLEVAPVRAALIQKIRAAAESAADPSKTADEETPGHAD